MPRISILDTDDAFSADDGETILAAAQRAGVAFPYSCQAGNCGSCKCELIDGDTFALEASEYALTPEERDRGLVLACRTQVWGDARIRRLDHEDLMVHPSRVLSCRVSRLEQLTHDIRGVWLEIEAGGPFVFSAGQYAQVDFAPGLGRHYSMANAPDDATLEFQIRHMPGGRCSAYVASALNVGDAVTVSGPHGSSYLRDHHAGPVLLAAGGSGLAPVQSMLKTMLARAFAAPVKLYFGVRAERDLYNEAMLVDWARRHPNLALEVVLSDDNGAAQRRHGFVHQAIDLDLDTVAGWRAYVAGPPVMVEAVSAVLQAKGMASRDIHADAFHNQP